MAQTKNRLRTPKSTPEKRRTKLRKTESFMVKMLVFSRETPQNSPKHPLKYDKIQKELPKRTENKVEKVKRTRFAKTKFV